MESQIRIVLVDKHPEIRRRIRSMLDQNGDTEVIGEAEDGPGAFNHIRKLKPDMVIVNVMMPNNDDIDFIHQIAKYLPHIKVIALTSYFHRDFVDNIFKAGANGYLLRESLFNELSNAIHKVKQNNIYISRAVVKKYCNLP